MGKRCIKCGDCCEFIATGFMLDEVINNPDFSERDFILEHWTPVEPPKENRNPLMSNKCFDGFMWYGCDLFDSETRLCKDYENRPQICRGYPNYHKPKDLISARCGYMSSTAGG